MICLIHFILGIQKSGFGECQSKKSWEGGGGILMDSKPEKARKYTTLPPHTESFN